MVGLGIGLYGIHEKKRKGCKRICGLVRLRPKHIRRYFAWVEKKTGKIVNDSGRPVIQVNHFVKPCLEIMRNIFIVADSFISNKANARETSCKLIVLFPNPIGEKQIKFIEYRYAFYKLIHTRFISFIKRNEGAFNPKFKSIGIDKIHDSVQRPHRKIFFTRLKNATQRYYRDHIGMFSGGLEKSSIWGCIRKLRVHVETAHHIKSLPKNIKVIYRALPQQSAQFFAQFVFFVGHAASGCCPA